MAERPVKQGSFDVRLDEERQILVVMLGGVLSLEQFEAMAQETRAAGDKLKNPRRVRIVVDARTMQIAPRLVRKRAAEMAAHPNVYRMAFWGPRLSMRAGLLFLSVMVGRDRVRVFKTEGEALDWLFEHDRERCDGQ